MIASIDMAAVRYDIDEPTKKYIIERIGALDRYLPRHARKSVTADVKLTLINEDHGNKYQAEVMINVPDKVLTAKDANVTMIGSVDKVVSKLLAQLRKYKQATILHIGQKHLHQSGK